jgi:7,8-dihydroneopterin aldolase/epimerase/oxygenase
MPENDHITLHGLGLNARVGVPEAERAVPQRLAADVTLWPAAALSGLGDELRRTVNYSQAAGVCRETGARGEFRLIETLADALCGALLDAFRLRRVRITLRKFVVPDAESVSVTLTRGEGPSAAPSVH